VRRNGDGVGRKKRGRVGVGKERGNKGRHGVRVCVEGDRMVCKEGRKAGARSGQVRSGQVRSGQVRSGQVRSGQVRSGQVRSGHIK
jgi:hypothetical protein